MTYDIPTRTVRRPLHEWLLGLQRSSRPQPRHIRVRHAVSPTQSREAVRPSPSKRLFLLELECLGAIPAAAQEAGCTVADVRAWRAADPKFDRDVVFAAAAYLRTLERMLAEAVATLPESRAREARALLDAKPAFRGPDGRLDAVAWRNALRQRAAELRLDPTRWEPRAPGNS